MGAHDVMTAIRRANPADFGEPYTYEAWQSETFFHKPLKPRRRAVRRQVEPQERLYDSFVDWPIRVGEPPRPLWRNYDHVLAVIVLIAIFAVAIYATGHSARLGGA